MTASHLAALDAMRRSFYTGELPLALRAGQELLDTIDPASTAAGKQALRARVLFWLTRCARRNDDLDVALAHAYAGIAAAQAGANGRLECLLKSQYVHVLTSLGQNESALDEGYRVVRQAVDSGGPTAEAACHLALGHVHWNMRQWDQGKAAYTRAQALSRRRGEKEIYGLASNGIAAMEDHYASEARAAGRADDALAHARRSFALLDEFRRSSLEIGDTYNAWIAAYNQACCRLGMGEHEASRELLNTQLALLDGESGSRRQLILQTLGDIRLAQGDAEAAVACQTEALEIAERLHLPALAMDACRSLVDALERKGDFEPALAQHRRFHAFYVQLASDKAQAHARAMAVIYETEKSHALARSQQQRADRLALANSSLTQEKVVLQRTSMEDALTGLANRRHFDQALAETMGAARTPLGSALAMIDVDHFKLVNDRLSHQTGDEVLRRLGALLQRHCRRHDLAARYGGEEFVLILTDVDRPTARATCERLRAAVEAEPWSVVHPDLHVTVSIGVVHATEAKTADERQALLEATDRRLYAAKNGGRNRVVDED